MGGVPAETRPLTASPFPGTVGRYELLLPIASGGMATVYLARQRGAGGFTREVALKLTHAHLREQPNWATELVEEAKLASRIAHPNVVQVIDVDDDPSGVFLVMPYIEGDSLSGLIKLALNDGQPLPIPIAFKILDDALAGLHAAHELRDGSGASMGLVHRDFSPQNVLVGIDGVARLADFGVAKASNRVGYTQTGMVKGKFGYMSPEQVRDAPLDRRSDVWAAGVVAWELLAGRRMFPSTDQPSTLLRIVSEIPPRVREVRPDAPAALDEAIATALEIDVRRRCATAEELRLRLQHAAAELGGVADQAEVASYVEHRVTPKLVERRHRIVELHEQRTQLRTVAIPAQTSLVAPREQDREASGPAEVGTDASLVSGTAPAPPPRSRARTLVVLAIAGSLALALALIAWRVRLIPTGGRTEAAALPAMSAEPLPPVPIASAAPRPLDEAPAPSEPPAQASARSPTSPASHRVPARTTAPQRMPARGAPTASSTPPAPVPSSPAPPQLHETPYE